jgi:Glu-tRNA(Gln) amidotransferase subunit E-like FAD-binding protein
MNNSSALFEIFKTFIKKAMIVYDGSQIRGGKIEKELFVSQEKNSRRRIYKTKLEKELKNLFQDETYKEFFDQFMDDNRVYNLNINFVSYAIYAFAKFYPQIKNLTNDLLKSIISDINKSKLSLDNTEKERVTLARYIRFFLSIFRE